MGELGPAADLGAFEVETVGGEKRTGLVAVEAQGGACAGGEAA